MTDIARDEKGRWLKGQSANPKGRKPIPDEVKEALKLNSMNALNVILNIMNDEEAPTRDRKDCACYVLDKTYGKNFQVYKDEEDGVVSVRIIEDID